MDRVTCARFARLFAYPRGEPQLEEEYCATFDFAPESAPYLGVHLCPDKRALFLAALTDVYAREDFTPQEELPDHLCEVLRFLAVAHDEQTRDELIHDGLLPTLEKITPALKGHYRALAEELRKEAAS